MSTYTGWAWYGPFTHVLRGSEVVKTFRVVATRRRALAWVDQVKPSTIRRGDPSCDHDFEPRSTMGDPYESCDKCGAMRDVASEVQR